MSSPSLKRTIDNAGPSETRIISGTKDAKQFIRGFLRRAGESVPGKRAFLWTARDKSGPLRALEYSEILRKARKDNPDFEMMYLTDVQEENVSSVKEMLACGWEVRHLQGNSANFTVSATEYITVIGRYGNGQGTIREILWSCNPALVEQTTQIFERLWHASLPAEKRIVEIQQRESLGQTRVINGTKEVSNAVSTAISDSTEEFDAYLDTHRATSFLESSEYRDKLVDAKWRGVRLRLIADLSKGDLLTWRGLMEFFELKHYEGAIGNLVVNEREALSMPSSATLGGPGFSLVYSDAPKCVEEQRRIFEVLWNVATPAEKRIKEIEKGVAPVKTEIVSGVDHVTRMIFSLVKNWEEDAADSDLFFTGDSASPVRLRKLTEYLEGVSKDRSRIKCLFDVQKISFPDIKRMEGMGIQVRHMEGNRMRLIISEREIISANETASPSNFSLPGEIIWSNNPELIGQMSHAFRMMWESAIPAETRIIQLEQGVDPGETKISHEVAGSEDIFETLFSECREEYLGLIASEQVVLRNAKLYKKILRRANSGMKIRLLVPAVSGEASRILEGLNWRRIEQISMGLAVFDRSKMLIAQYTKPDAPTREGASISNIVSTNKRTIEGMVTIFEALWQESEIRDRERRAREREERLGRQARLMQDILTHDIRNYNQVTKLGAELLQEMLRKESADAQMVLQSILQSVDGSTSLLERAKRLGRVLSEDNPRLVPVDLIVAINNSIALVQRSNPEKILKWSVRCDVGSGQTEFIKDAVKEGEAYVLADDLLEEVFVNIFANSAKYTQGSMVELDVEIRGEEKSDPHMVKISITDHGRGVPDEMKDVVFNRYLKSAKGSGLGMSIVHALVAGRYGGRISLKDRVDGDYSQGTTVEIFLPVSNAGWGSAH